MLWVVAVVMICNSLALVAVVSSDLNALMRSALHMPDLSAARFLAPMSPAKKMEGQFCCVWQGNREGRNMGLACLRWEWFVTHEAGSTY